jgi:diguanylate cyclase (GGDEF)-like protein
MFGMFGLSSRQVLWVGVYTLALFGFVMAVCSRSNPEHYPVAGEIVYFMMLCIMVAGVGLLTVRLHRMRDRLRRQKVELEAALAHIHRLATHDDLTGLVNRRHMQELLENERMRLERSEQDWCVALIDLDHFKAVNDAHGHAIGDEVLRALSRHAHTLIRRTDVLARWGGEEFVLLLPNTPLGMAVTSLERLREHFHANPLVVHGIELPVSFSAGLTEHLRGETIAQTLERADKLCYRAKPLGRNRVERG